MDFSDCVKYVGVLLDANLNLKRHITQKCKVASFNLYRLRSIRKYLTQEACASLILGTVIVHHASRLCKQRTFCRLTKCGYQTPSNASGYGRLRRRLYWVDQQWTVLHSASKNCTGSPYNFAFTTKSS